MTNQQEFKIERNSDTVFGAQSAPSQQKSAREAAKEAAAKEAAAKETTKAADKPMEIVDQGAGKSSKIADAIKKIFKFILTLVLLVAVLLGAVIGLKQFGIFDATGFIPFPIPFTGAPASQEPVPEPQPAQPAQPLAAQPAQPEAQPKVPDLSPQIIYFTRTYRASPSGPSLEDKINDNATRQGGDYGQVDWQVKQGGEGLFEIAALVPAKSGKLTYTFIVDYNKKSLLPSDESGKAAFDALSAPPKRAKTTGKSRKQPPAAKTAPKKAAAPKPAKPAASKKAKPAADEYEYVYEDDDGTGQ